MEQDTSLESWNDFAGDFIKAEFVTDAPTKFAVKGIGSKKDEKTGRPLLIVEIEYNEREWKFDLNKTNQSFLRKNGITRPKDVVGKLLHIDKIKVRNPTTNQQVDGLSIIGIE